MRIIIVMSLFICFACNGQLNSNPSDYNPKHADHPISTSSKIHLEDLSSYFYRMCSCFNEDIFRSSIDYSGYVYSYDNYDQCRYEWPLPKIGNSRSENSFFIKVRELKSISSWNRDQRQEFKIEGFESAYFQKNTLFVKSGSNELYLTLKEKASKSPEEIQSILKSTLELIIGKRKVKNHDLVFGRSVTHSYEDQVHQVTHLIDEDEDLIKSGSLRIDKKFGERSFETKVDGKYDSPKITQQYRLRKNNKLFQVTIEDFIGAGNPTKVEIARGAITNIAKSKPEYTFVEIPGRYIGMVLRRNGITSSDFVNKDGIGLKIWVPGGRPTLTEKEFDLIVSKFKILQ